MRFLNLYGVFTHTNLDYYRGFFIFMSKFVKNFLIITLFVLFAVCLVGAKNITRYASCDLDNLYVHLKIDGKTYHYTYPEITYKSGFEDILINQGKYDKKGRLVDIKGSITAEYEFKDLKKYLCEIATITDIEPVNAKVSFDPENVKLNIKPDIPGRRLNVDKIVRDVNDSLKLGLSYSAEITSEKVFGNVTEASLKRSFNLRGDFSTSISESTEDRKNNVALSIKQFNGLVIAPNEEVSFNKIVGERTEKRGYKMAKIILDGEFTDGIGGGVCQTSTTLYNALLLSDIDITSYKKHTLKVNYVVPSFDAMVSSCSDLKFKNNSGNYIYIKTTCSNDTVNVKIYGEKLKHEIVRKSEIISTGDIPKDRKIIDTAGKYLDKVKYEDEYYIMQSSKPKIVSAAYLQYIKNGKVVKTKKIRQDIYSEQSGIIIYGALKRPVPIPMPDIKNEINGNEPRGYLE